MKALTKVLQVLMVVSLLFTGCDKNDPESATDKTKRLLKSTWQLESLMVNNTEQTSMFPNLILTVTDGSYTTQNGEPVWPTSGTWSLTNTTTVLRSDNVVITIDELTATTLVLSFQWEDTTLGEGRVQSISGVHVFEFTKVQ